MTIQLLHNKTPKAYKNNKLNAADFRDFSHRDYLVFLHLISKIGGVDSRGKYLQPTEIRRDVMLSAKEFSNVFSVDIDNSYKYLNKSIKKLMKTSISLEKIHTEEVWEINICSAAKYNKNKGYINIQFTDTVMPYLAQVKEKFVLYNLKEISNFRSLFTTRLYELLVEFKKTGWVTKSVDQLRALFGTGKKFKLYADFKRKTFGKACEEINKIYKLNITFEELKQGKKVTAIKFSFRPPPERKLTLKSSRL